MRGKLGGIGALGIIRVLSRQLGVEGEISLKLVGLIPFSKRADPRYLTSHKPGMLSSQALTQSKGYVFTHCKSVATESGMFSTGRGDLMSVYSGSTSCVHLE